MEEGKSRVDAEEREKFDSDERRLAKEKKKEMILIQIPIPIQGKKRIARRNDRMKEDKREKGEDENHEKEKN